MNRLKRLISYLSLYFLFYFYLFISRSRFFQVSYIRITMKKLRIVLNPNARKPWKLWRAMIAHVLKKLDTKTYIRKIHTGNKVIWWRNLISFATFHSVTFFQSLSFSSSFNFLFVSLSFILNSFLPFISRLTWTMATCDNGVKDLYPPTRFPLLRTIEA